MELVALLQVLWRHRIIAAAGMMLSILCGLAAVRGEDTSFGTASTRVMVDTTSSLTVDAFPKGAPTLEWRAGLLADVVGSEEARERIARLMQINADRLLVVAPYMAAPAVHDPLPTRAIDAAASETREYEVAVQGAAWLPIIGIDARAPSRQEAIRLTAATVDTLEAEVIGSAEAGQRFVLEDIADVRSRTVTDGPRRSMAVVIAGVIGAIWLSGVMVMDTLLARRRRPARPGAVTVVAEGPL